MNDKITWEITEAIVNRLLENSPPAKVVVEQTEEAKELAECMESILRDMYATIKGKTNEVYLESREEQNASNDV